MVIEVIEGRGGEIITSAKGLKYTPIALVIFAVSFPFFIMLNRLISWFLNSDERDFKKILRNKNLKQQSKLKPKESGLGSDFDDLN